MNNKIEVQRAFKRRFGITIHSNMGIEEIIKAWDKVPDITKQLASIEFLALIGKLKESMEIIGDITNAYILASQAYLTCELAIDAGVAIMAGQPQQPLLQMGVKLSKDAMINSKDELLSILALAIGKLSSEG